MTNIVIAEENYLIRKGLVQLLHQLENIQIEEVVTFNELKLTLKHKKSSFVIINNKIIESAALYISLQNEYSFNTILILDCSSGVGSNVPYKCILDINDPEEMLLEKINSVIRDTGQNHKKENNTLSQREILILKHVAEGLTNKEIADTLYISAHTVITHRKNITNKLGIRSISGLTVYAILNNIININEVKN